jgi:hypothetical protein
MVHLVSALQLFQRSSDIRDQERHHRKMTFDQEFVALLKKHGVEFDPKYALG